MDAIINKGIIAINLGEAELSDAARERVGLKLAKAVLEEGIRGGIKDVGLVGRLGQGWWGGITPELAEAGKLAEILRKAGPGQ